MTEKGPCSCQIWDTGDGKMMRLHNARDVSQDIEVELTRYQAFAIAALLTQPQSTGDVEFIQEQAVANMKGVGP